jgi:DNA-binding MarR family transcriptional regulator
MLEILRVTIVTLVRRDGPDLPARQFGLFLIGYLENRDHTVRGLAGDLKVSRPAITRGLDRLEALELVRREVDPRDRRSVLVRRTAKGNALLRELKKILGAAAASATNAPGVARHRT